MTGLNETSLARMRQQLAHLLPDTAVIEAPVRTADEVGGWRTTWEPVTGGTVPCRLDPVGYREEPRVLAGRVVGPLRYRLTVPYDAPLAHHRRVLVGGTVYRIENLAASHSWRVARQADIRRLE